MPWRLPDRKSTRLNSSHANISYAVFCLKKKNKTYYYDEQLIPDFLPMLKSQLPHAPSPEGNSRASATTTRPTTAPVFTVFFFFFKETGPPRTSPFSPPPPPPD